MQRRTRVLSVTGGVIVSALIVVASAAFACVSLATLDVSPGKGAPGTTVKASFTGVSSNAGFSDIELRWGGALLATVPKPASSQNFTFNFTVPDAAPGTYVLSASQTDPAGAPIWGMPARVTFTVPGAAAGVAPATEAAPAAETVTVEQKYLVAGEAPAPAVIDAPAAEVVQAPRVRTATAPPAPTPAPAAEPAKALSLEARDAITEQVAPAGAREVSYVPAAGRSSASNGTALNLGIALAVIGSMALLTAFGAAYILRPAQARASR
jgi:hypothetical protein